MYIYCHPYILLLLLLTRVLLHPTSPPLVPLSLLLRPDSLSVLHLKRVSPHIYILHIPFTMHALSRQCYIGALQLRSWVPHTQRTYSPNGYWIFSPKYSLTHAFSSTCPPSIPPFTSPFYSHNHLLLRLHPVLLPHQTSYLHPRLHVPPSSTLHLLSTVTLFNYTLSPSCATPCLQQNRSRSYISIFSLQRAKIGPQVCFFLIRPLYTPILRRECGLWPSNFHQTLVCITILKCYTSHTSWYSHSRALKSTLKCVFSWFDPFTPPSWEEHLLYDLETFTKRYYVYVSWNVTPVIHLDILILER